MKQGRRRGSMTGCCRRRGCRRRGCWRRGCWRGRPPAARRAAACRGSRRLRPSERRWCSRSCPGTGRRLLYPSTTKKWKGGRPRYWEQVPLGSRLHNPHTIMMAGTTSSAGRSLRFRSKPARLLEGYTPCSIRHPSCCSTCLCLAHSSHTLLPMCLSWARRRQVRTWPGAGSSLGRPACFHWLL